MGSFFEKLSRGMRRSRDGIAQLLPGSGPEMSEAGFMEIEDALILADCGAEIAQRLVARARKERREPLAALRQAMLDLLASEEKPVHRPASGPFVLLVVGVNGTGKTTTIGKLAAMFARDGKRVLVGAADTFRAAAVEQLAAWVERAGGDMVRQQAGADPAAVAFDAISRGVARNYDVVIVDTAGRVQTDRGLMDELAKVRRVIEKAHAGAPHEVWHVVDGGTGQNAVVQVERFREVAGTTGLIVTKLDGTAKGGIVVAIARELNLPIRFVGTGEQIDDLVPFDAQTYVNSLFD